VRQLGTLCRQEMLNVEDRSANWDILPVKKVANNSASKADEVHEAGDSDF